MYLLVRTVRFEPHVEQTSTLSFVHFSPGLKKPRSSGSKIMISPPCTKSYNITIQNILTIFKEGRSSLDKEKRQKSFLKLEELVNARKMTIYALAKELGFSSTLFSDWKSGKSMPKTDKLLKIAGFFGVSVDYFLII